MKVYLDNAATTPLEPAVFEEMKPYFLDHFGNPSSIHSHGRQVRAAIEKARKKIAELLNTSPAEIFFTSGGTEADNTALRCTVETLDIQHLITTKIEHHAVLHCAQLLEKEGKVSLHYLDLDAKGNIDLSQLDELLKRHPQALVSLMHGNNEIGNLNDLEAIGNLCREHGALFHSDTVQTMGHYAHVLEHLPVDFVVGSAHKFHGPKGVGFLYVHHNTKIHPFIHGGAQERNMRGGTEHVAGIIGMAKALEMAYEAMHSHQTHIEQLKKRLMDRLSPLPGIQFHGESGDLSRSLYTVLNVGLPPSSGSEMLLFNLDIKGISVSGGSACSSGSSIGSHVLNELQTEAGSAVRFSFSRYNTPEEIDFAAEQLESIVAVGA
jgi:cysteine desulfurase